MPSREIDLGARLRAAGESLADELGPLVRHADPRGTVAPRSLVLCAALSELSTAVAAALGAADAVADVARVGALLSWLTKIDDQVIDGRNFHGGAATDRARLRRRVRRRLAPTLASVRAGMPTTPAPRCALAAEVGRRAARLAGSAERLDDFLDLVAAGWSVQVDAVERLTAPLDAVTDAEVDETTGAISGSWLLMIAAVGALPPTARRAVSDDERRAFHAYGRHIQRADALADLEKDLGDGLLGTWPARLLWRCRGADPGAARRAPPAAETYARLAAADVDLACLPAAGDLDELDRRLAGLGEIPALLRWVHGFLLARYLCHPLARREPADARFAPFVAAAHGWRALIAAGAAPGAPSAPAHPAEVACSAP